MSINACKTVITFDVDGTLIRATGADANKLHKDAFAFAMNEVFGIDTTIDVVHHHGFTDPLVLIAVLEHHGVDKAQVMDMLPGLQAAMLEFAGRPEAKAEVAVGLEVLPGIREVLAALLERDDCLVGLVTGNLEPIGWLKMEALGLEFSRPHFGGFGSDFCSGNTKEVWRDRAVFVTRARERALATFEGLEVAGTVHVGDTPYDIKAGEEGGATSVGVCTGVFSRAELEASASRTSTVILDDMSDTEAALRAFGLAL